MATQTNCIVVDRGRLPLVDIAFRGKITLDDYRTQLNRMVEICKNEKPPFILLLDMRDFNPFNVNAAMRRAASAVWHENEDLYLRTIAAEARVVEDTITRGIITAFDWMTSKKGKWPCRQFAKMDVAEAWLRETLEKWNATKGEGARL